MIVESPNRTLSRRAGSAASGILPKFADNSSHVWIAANRVGLLRISVNSALSPS
jgi:hypothetical protein